MGRGLGHGDLAFAIVLVVLQLLFHINIVEVSEDLRDFEFTHISLLQKISLSL